MAARRKPTTSRTGRPSRAEGVTRGEAAWRAQRDAIAERNQRASERARERRQQDYEALVARRRAAERRERAELKQRRP
jgi:hypothetical protein